MLDIRKADEDDCEVIFQFIVLLAKYEKLEHEIATTPEQLKQNLFLKQSSSEVYLGYIDKTPVCFALCFTNFSTFLGKAGIYLEDLYVKEEHRGKGYGKKMLQFLAQRVIEKDYGRLEWSVLDWNTPAIDFYTRLGAKAMDEWTVYRLTGNALHNLTREK